MLPVGIGNFATGLVQGLRQNKEDARQAEQDAMKKQEFDLQQQQGQFNLQNAKDVAGRQTQEYDRAQGIQQKRDAFLKNFGAAHTALSSGDENGAMAGVETTLNDPTTGLTHKAVFDRDANGNIVKGPNGYTLRYMDPATGKEVSKVEGDASKIMEGAYIAHDAIGEFGKQQDEKKAATIKAADNAFAMTKIKLIGDQHLRAVKAQSDAALRQIKEKGRLGMGTGAKPEKTALSATGLSLIKDVTTVGKDENGNPIIKPVLNVKKLGQFQAWAKANGVHANDDNLQIWLGNAAPTTDPTEPAAAPPSIDFSELE